MMKIFFLMIFLPGVLAAQSLSLERDSDIFKNGTDGVATIEILSEPLGAEVFLGPRFIGITPLEIPSFRSGLYEFSLLKKGYIPFVFQVQIEEKENLKLLAVLNPQVGYLKVKNWQPHWIARLGEEPLVLENSSHKPGDYTLFVREFGWEDASLKVQILEEKTTEVEVPRTPAQLKLVSFSFHSDIINPQNPGLLGELSGYYSVNAPGKVYWKVLNSAREVLWESPKRELTTWDHTFRQSFASEHPETDWEDGRYLLFFYLENSEGEVQLFEKLFTLDRSHVLMPRSHSPFASGLRYAPDALTLPSGTWEMLFQGGAALPPREFLAFTVGFKAGVPWSGEFLVTGQWGDPLQGSSSLLQFSLGYKQSMMKNLGLWAGGLVIPESGKANVRAGMTVDWPFFSFQFLASPFLLYQKDLSNKPLTWGISSGLIWNWKEGFLGLSAEGTPEDVLEGAVPFSLEAAQMISGTTMFFKGGLSGEWGISGLSNTQFYLGLNTFN